MSVTVEVAVSVGVPLSVALCDPVALGGAVVVGVELPVEAPVELADADALAVPDALGVLLPVRVAVVESLTPNVFVLVRLRVMDDVCDAVALTVAVSDAVPERDAVPLELGGTELLPVRLLDSDRLPVREGVVVCVVPGVTDAVTNFVFVVEIVALAVAVA